MTAEHHAHRPQVAVVDGNTLASMGLRQLLQSVVPVLEVHVFGSFTELESASPERFAHYFVAMDIVLSHRAFFSEHRRQTIVLTMSLSDSAQLSEFHSLSVNQPESALVRSLLMLHQAGHPHGHSHGHRLTEAPQTDNSPARRLLTDREIEVMSLVVQGLINKEIAERLHIALATVVTHRKNVMDKLGVRSVSALTIYAVTHGYVDINKI